MKQQRSPANLARGLCKGSLHAFVLRCLELDFVRAVIGRRCHCTILAQTELVNPLQPQGGRVATVRGEARCLDLLELGGTRSLRLYFLG